MLGALKRVISGENVKEQKDGAADAPAPPSSPPSTDEAVVNTNDKQEDGNNDAPAVFIESEDDGEMDLLPPADNDNDVNVRIIGTDRMGPGILTPRSSLSDVSAADDDDDDEEKPVENVVNQNKHHHHNTSLDNSPLSSSNNSDQDVKNHGMAAHPDGSGSNSPNREEAEANASLDGDDLLLQADPRQMQLSSSSRMQQPQQQPPQFAFRRSDSKASNDGSSSAAFSRAGSQTSSRDWGWFEDVHISASEQLQLQTSQQQQQQQQQQGGDNNNPHLKRKDETSEKGGDGSKKKGKKHEVTPALLVPVSGGLDNSKYE